MRTIIGCMSGTSMDAVDAALVFVEGHGLDLTTRFGRLESEPFGLLRDELLRVASGDAVTAGEQARLARQIGETHARAIARLVGSSSNIDLICAHGQTVFHARGLTAQWLDPWPIAIAQNCPVLFDLRRADVIAGGQGAPITPLADWVLFRSSVESRAIVNLGGFCNVTALPAGAALHNIHGFDVCACNQILDEAARRVLGKPFDESGAAAASGKVHDEATQDLARLLAKQSEAGRSLGSGDEARTWIEKWENRLEAPNLLASACGAIGRVIGERVREADSVILAGGGALNDALVDAIVTTIGRPVKQTDEFGVPVRAREAVAMAILGALCADGVRVTLPQVTGRSDAPLLDGCWTNARIAT